MPIVADREYDGTISHASTIFSQSGTCGIQITIDSNGNGQIQHVFWLTEKTAERVKSTLKKLGCKESELTSETALENIGHILGGKECRFTTVEESYKDKARVKVQWVNAPKTENQGSAAKTAAALFSGKGPAGQDIGDDDIPF